MSALRLVTYGDSITAHLNLSEADGYALKLANRLGIPLVNRAVSGWMAGNASTDTVALQTLPTDAVVIMLGTNDERIYGTSPALRSLAMEAIRDVAVKAFAPLRTVAGSMALSGAWLGGHGFLGKYTDDAGATATTVVNGSTVWVGYIASAWPMAHGKATVSIDGGVVDTIEIDAGGIPLATQNNPSTPWFPVTKSYGGLSNGPHTVTITTTVQGQRFYLEYVAGADQPKGASVYISNVIRQSPAGYATYGGSDANILDYNAAITGLVTELGATLVDNWSAINPLSSDMQADGIHVSASGNTKLSNTFYAAMMPPPIYTEARIEVDATNTFYAVKADGTGRVTLQTVL